LISIDIAAMVASMAVVLAGGAKADKKETAAVTADVGR
jgi:hypothetical protein